MANVKISQLTPLTTPAAADLVPVTDSSASQTKRTTVGEIVGIINGDVDVADDGAATISELPVYKLQDGDARQLLQTDAAGLGVEWTSDVNVPGTLDVIGEATLSSAAVSDLTDNRVVIAGVSGELEVSPNLTFSGTELGITGTLDVSSDCTIGGDLTVEGTTTTIESQTITIKDKNIELGVVPSPTNATADGGGITLKGSIDKTINWIDSTDAWTLSEHVNIASAKEYRIDGTKVLDATSLGGAVVSSSLTSVGTIGTGVWNGTAIATAYIADSAVTSAKIADGAIVNADINASAAIADTKLAAISTGGKVSNSATTATAVNTASAIVARDGSGNFAAGTVTAALTGNASTATALETARNIGGVSFDGTASINLPGVNAAGNQDTSGNAATSTALSSARNFAVTGDVTGTVSSDLTGGASIATSIASDVIVNADVNASAAIAGTKIDPDFGSQAVTTTGLISAHGKVSFPPGTAALPSLYPGSDTSTGIYFPGTDQVGISTNGVARLITDDSGNVLIGVAVPYTSGAYLHVPVAGSSRGAWASSSGSSSSRKHMRFENPNGEVGSISTSGTATSFTTSSDYRLKENIVPLTDAADRVNQLRVHRFNFLADPDTVVDGFLAHEAQAIVPECVTGTKDEVDENGNPVYQGIDQSKLVPLLTAALQNAIGEIETVKQRLTDAGIA
jgi:cytoskeletal protein CcmA (bactofilin family)